MATARAVPLRARHSTPEHVLGVACVEGPSSAGGDRRYGDAALEPGGGAARLWRETPPVVYSPPERRSPRRSSPTRATSRCRAPEGRHGMNRVGCLPDEGGGRARRSGPGRAPTRGVCTHLRSPTSRQQHGRQIERFERGSRSGRRGLRPPRVNADKRPASRVPRPLRPGARRHRHFAPAVLRNRRPRDLRPALASVPWTMSRRPAVRSYTGCDINGRTGRSRRSPSLRRRGPRGIAADGAIDGGWAPRLWPARDHGPADGGVGDDEVDG